MNKRVNIPEKEKAFVLQGGGSLGAYGAGVYSGLYESLSKMDIEEGNKENRFLISLQVLQSVQ
jgi:hypothetical protein